MGERFVEGIDTDGNAARTAALLVIFALVVLSVLGTSVPTLIGTIAILDSTRVFRVSRAVAMGIVAMDYVEAHKWWNISASNGEERARRNRNQVERLMKPEQIAEAKRRAEAWMKAHAKQ